VVTETMIEASEAVFERRAPNALLEIPERYYKEIVAEIYKEMSMAKV